MINIIDNLNNKICDCEPESKNEMTYLEYILYAYDFFNSPLVIDDIEWLQTIATNEELNEIIEEIDYLMEK